MHLIPANAVSVFAKIAKSRVSILCSLFNETMSEVSSFGLTERELKEIILPNINKIDNLTATVHNLPVLKTVECTLKDADKLLWETSRIRIVSHGNLSKSINGVLTNGMTEKETLSFSVLVKPDRPKPIEDDLIPTLLKHYELLYFDTKRLQILATENAHQRLHHTLQNFSEQYKNLPNYVWKQINLPPCEDSSHLALNFIAAQVLSWANRTYNKDDEWENFLNQLYQLPILSSENASRFITYINNKPDIDEQERKKKKELIKTIVDDGILKGHSFLSVTEDVEFRLNRKCNQTEVKYIQKRYTRGSIDHFLWESDQTLQSDFTKKDEEVKPRSASLLDCLKKLSKIEGS